MQASMSIFWDVIIKLLDAVQPAKMVEIGALRGDLTRKLCAWAQDNACPTRSPNPASRPNLRLRWDSSNRPPNKCHLRKIRLDPTKTPGQGQVQALRRAVEPFRKES